MNFFEYSELVWSLVCCTFISVLNLSYMYNNEYVYYKISTLILFVYLYVDLIGHSVFGIILNDKTFHHILGIVSIMLSYAYNFENILSLYINYEISTIFLNIYLLKKNVLTFTGFFISFTFIRIIYGSYISFMTLASCKLIFISIIVVVFQLLNYYWYVVIIGKLSKKIRAQKLELRV